MFNNEQIGVSAEIAIADFFGVPVSMNYRARGVSVVVESIKPIISGVFLQEMVPRPVLHVAERQNPIDFGLENNKTLSVKTNKQKTWKGGATNNRPGLFNNLV